MIICKKATLLNTTSKAMNVNAGPTVFSWSPPAPQVAHVLGLHLVLVDNAASGWADIGAISGPLTNGILFEAVIGGVAQEIFNIKDNVDLALAFHHNQFGSGMTTTLGAPMGFGGGQATFVGSFVNPIQAPLFNLASGDSIQATVRDNLTALVSLSVQVSYMIGIGGAS